jgi:hypothetical protein
VPAMHVLFFVSKGFYNLVMYFHSPATTLEPQSYHLGKNGILMLHFDGRLPREKQKQSVLA